MSTSPSPTAHWNFDTEEARDAWARADYDASKAAADEESAMVEADREALTQQMVDTLNEQAAHQRDLEEGRRLFPTPTPGRLSEDSTGGPPVTVRVSRPYDWTYIVVARTPRCHASRPMTRL